MTGEALAIYLTDHHSASIGAIEMVEHVISENAGTLFGRRLEEVLKEIKKDQVVLEELIEQIGSKESPLKKAGAWLAEKAGRLKLTAVGEPGELARLEVLEALTLGLQGKRALWRALRVVSHKHPALQALDLDLLERRSVEQRDRVEEWRLESAKEVL